MKRGFLSNAAWPEESLKKTAGGGKFF